LQHENNLNETENNLPKRTTKELVSMYVRYAGERSVIKLGLEYGLAVISAASGFIGVLTD
jgi:predicted transcriptional regulator with HTH domain